MKWLLITGVVLALLILPLLSACRAPSGEAADDLMITPGGYVYRANMHQAGVKNPWPHIDSKEVTIGESPDIAQITYRDSIETEAGQTRNNLFSIGLPNVDPSVNTYMKTVLRAGDLPSGITVTQISEGHGSDPARRMQTGLEIEISPDVAPGQYTFNIGIDISGKDYGTVPCTIDVIE
jgi:hypothetical protein